MTLEELQDSLEVEKMKPPITIVKYKTIIKEKIVEVPVISTDTLIKQGNTEFNSVLSFSSDSTWEKSSRSLGVSVPYTMGSDLTFTMVNK